MPLYIVRMERLQQFHYEIEAASVEDAIDKARPCEGDNGVDAVVSVEDDKGNVLWEEE